jgi:hypothetical protein
MRSGRFAAVVCGVSLVVVTAVGCKDQGCPDRSPKLGELTALADNWGTDKGTRGHRYTGVYELFFQPIRQEATKVLEIGVLKGASLRMWRDYFPRAVIHGIDIEDTSALNSDTIKTYIADQANRKQLQAFIDAAGSNFDIIVDDGGHSMEQQQVSFGYLFRHVKPGGYYVIEDVNTSIFAIYQGRFGATESGENTTLAMIDHFVRTGAIESSYMTVEEKDDLTRNVLYANLLSQSKGQSIACIFKRKGPMDERRRKRAPQGE